MLACKRAHGAAPTVFRRVRGLNLYRRPFASHTATTNSSDNVSKGPLKGVRVLDLTRILAGPFCTAVLGDYGADVIKVEHPRNGDDTRSWGPPFVDLNEPKSSRYSMKNTMDQQELEETKKEHDAAAGAGGFSDASRAEGGKRDQDLASTYFLSVNRNKRSVCIDLKSPEGVAIIHELARHSDVVVENFVPGKADALGFGYEHLRAINPRLIYASVSGYGQTGPKSRDLAYDVMVSAVGGLIGITGHPGGEPAKVGVAITDICAGLFLHGAVMAALYAREHTGVGQRIDTSLLQAQVGTLANVASAYLLAGSEPQRWGTAHASIVPYQAFRSSDGHVVVGALNEGQFQRLCQALERPEWAVDGRFATNPLRVANRNELLVLLGDIFALKPTQHWIELLERARVPCAPINDMRGVFNDPQVQHLGMVESVSVPGTEHQLDLVGPAVRFSDTPASVRLAPPRHGEHTASVLSEVCGFSEEDIVKLSSDGIIKAYSPAR